MRSLAILLLATALPLAAQPKSPAPKPPVSASSIPRLTENESLRLENLQLKATLLQQQFQQTPSEVELQKEFQSFLDKLKAEHPGYAFDPRTRAFVQAPPAGPSQQKEGSPR